MICLIIEYKTERSVCFCVKKMPAYGHENIFRPVGMFYDVKNGIVSNSVKPAANQAFSILYNPSQRGWISLAALCSESDIIKLMPTPSPL